MALFRQLQLINNKHYQESFEYITIKQESEDIFLKGDKFHSNKNDFKN